MTLARLDLMKASCVEGDRFVVDATFPSESVLVLSFPENDPSVTWFWPFRFSRSSR